MKKILLLTAMIAVFMAMAPDLKAQTALISPTYGNPLDTVVNTAVKVLWVKVTGYRETVTITANLTKISGTMGGTLVPIGSNDGVNFYDISQKGSDTVTVANVATAGKAYNCQRGYQYYGVQWTGTGTMSASISGKLIARRISD